MFREKQAQIAAELQRIRTVRLTPSAMNPEMRAACGLEGLQNGLSYEQLLRRPDFGYEQLADIDPQALALPLAVREQVEIQVKYQGYIERQQEQVEKLRNLETTAIPAAFDYGALPGLTAEIREKLLRFRPDTLGQASRISGVTPAAIAILSIAIKSRDGRR